MSAAIIALVSGVLAVVGLIAWLCRQLSTARQAASENDDRADKTEAELTLRTRERDEALQTLADERTQAQQQSVEAQHDLLEANETIRVLEAHLAGLGVAGAVGSFVRDELARAAADAGPAGAGAALPHQPAA